MPVKKNSFSKLKLVHQVPYPSILEKNSSAPILDKLNSAFFCSLFKPFKMKTQSYLMFSFLTSLFLSACSSIPQGATAVSPFEKEKYLGKWYEIARMDFKFEKNLNNTTAEYGVREDGKISVTNRGYNYVTHEWEEAVGKAKFAGAENVAMLKVSFFGPFYAGYNVIALDENYTYALVAGKDTSYLWILSREKSIPDTIKSEYLQIAKDLGYKTDELIWVEHNK
jgi:apolipoprotein D and lipocalin family protein